MTNGCIRLDASGVAGILEAYLDDARGSPAARRSRSHVFLGEVKAAALLTALRNVSPRHDNGGKRGDDESEKDRVELHDEALMRSNDVGLLLLCDKKRSEKRKRVSRRVCFVSVHHLLGVEQRDRTLLEGYFIQYLHSIV